MELGRNEKLHLSCSYEGHENDCPKECSKCAISIKTEGDIALSSNRLDDAIKQYKRALFVEPGFAEAWCNLANTYGMKSEYNNALSAFNKALAIDPQYGKAMFGKAITLRNLGKLEAAMELANDILELYDDPNVLNFKTELAKAGVKDTGDIYSLQKAIDAMTNKAHEIVVENNLSDKDGRINMIQAIDKKGDEFASQIYAFCKRRYGSLGNEKIWSESILAAFYGSAFITLRYYLNPDDLNDVELFGYLCNNVNMEALDRNAERLLGIQDDDGQSESVWNIIYSFVSFSTPIIGKVEPVSDIDAAVKDATESAYVMGMLLAMRHHDQEEIEANRSALDKALEKLAESAKDYNYTPPETNNIRYQLRDMPKVPLYFKCNGCNQNKCIEVYDESGCEQQIINRYKALANLFTQLGYPATVKCFCNLCAKRLFPSNDGYTIHNFVFSLVRPDREKPVNSFPRTAWFDNTQYRITLAFLRGADTITALSEATNTRFSAHEYLKYVHNVLGNGISKTGGIDEK